MLRNVGDSLHSVVKEREHAGSIEMRYVATGGKKEMPRVAAKKKNYVNASIPKDFYFKFKEPKKLSYYEILFPQKYFIL